MRILRSVPDTLDSQPLTPTRRHVAQALAAGAAAIALVCSLLAAGSLTTEAAFADEVPAAATTNLNAPASEHAAATTPEAAVSITDDRAGTERTGTADNPITAPKQETMADTAGATAADDSAAASSPAASSGGADTAASTQTAEAAAAGATASKKPTSASTSSATAGKTAQTTPAKKKVKPVKVGSKMRPVANGVYSVLNRANRSFSLSFFTGSNGMLKRFTAARSQTFVLRFDQAKKAYTVRIASSNAYLAAGAKQGSSQTVQLAKATSDRAFWRIHKTKGGWRLVNLASKRTLKAGSAREGSRVVVGITKESRSFWSLYPLRACKKVSSSARLNRMVNFIIRTKTQSGDSNPVKLNKVYYYLASTAFSYAHVDNQRRPTEKGWSERYALNMSICHQGNCFSISSLFGYLARACGYQARIISGDVTAFTGGLAKHGWTMLKVAGGYDNQYPIASKKGHWHVFDPEASASYAGNFFNITQGGHWPSIYHYTHNELTE